MLLFVKHRWAKIWTDGKVRPVTLLVRIMVEVLVVR